MVKLPEEFVKQTRKLMGEERFARYLAAFSEEPPVSIRLNPSLITPNSSLLTPNSSLLTQQVPWCPLGYYLPERPNFTFDPLLHAGCYYVQEAASMFLHHVLSEEFFAKQSGKAERRVKNEEFAAATPSADGIPVGNSSFFTLHSSLSMALDLCAAPGGKSTLLRALLPDEALLYSNEPVRQRASILSENIQKWGHRGSIVTNNYPQDYVRSGLMFDLILCDVPCSGEGMFRRDPQTIGEWSPQQVEKCWRLQRDIVSQAWQCLRPGGLLIYSTCTFNIKENEENVRWMMEQLEADIVSVPTLPEWNITGSLLEGFNAPVYRFIPGITRSEGLFVAVMRKKGDRLKVESDGLKVESDRLKMKGGRRKLSSLHPSPSTRHLSPSLLRVLFDGRQPCEEAVATAELTYAEAISYLRGEALRLAPDVPRGLVDVCFMGQRLGRVKNIGSRANNLYPKEWRIRSTHGPADYQPIVG